MLEGTLLFKGVSFGIPKCALYSNNIFLKRFIFLICLETKLSFEQQQSHCKKTLTTSCSSAIQSSKVEGINGKKKLTWEKNILYQNRHLDLFKHLQMKPDDENEMLSHYIQTK